MTRLALIAGAGGLPGALVAALPERPLICAPEGFAPAGLTVDQTFRIERLAVFLAWLEDQGVTHVSFAGAVQRPRLDPSLFDPATATMVPRLLAAMGQGDDATLREVLGIFTEFGFSIVGVADIEFPRGATHLRFARRDQTANRRCDKDGFRLRSATASATPNRNHYERLISPIACV